MAYVLFGLTIYFILVSFLIELLKINRNNQKSLRFIIPAIILTTIAPIIMLKYFFTIKNKKTQNEI